MEIKVFEHENVAEDGTLEEGGAVFPMGGVTVSSPDGGCGQGRCQCSPGHWISIILPRDCNGKVIGCTIRFDNKIQMMKMIEFLNGHFGLKK